MYYVLTRCATQPRSIGDGTARDGQRAPCVGGRWPTGAGPGGREGRGGAAWWWWRRPAQARGLEEPRDDRREGRPGLSRRSRSGGGHSTVSQTASGRGAGATVVALSTVGAGHEAAAGHSLAPVVRAPFTALDRPFAP